MNMTLKHDSQGHLNLARAADGFVYRAQRRGTVVESRRRILSSATSGQRRRPHYRELVVVLVLRDVIDGNIKAGRIGQVEDLQAVIQRVAFRNEGFLYERNVGDPLPALPEDVAQAVREVGLESVVG